MGAQPRIMCWTCAHGPLLPDVILDVPQWWQLCVNFGLQHIGAPTVVALIRAHCSIERRQPAASDCWQALHRLERGRAARASQRGKTSSGNGRTVSTRHSRGASRARCTGRSHQKRTRGAPHGAAGRRLQQRRRRGHWR